MVDEKLKKVLYDKAYGFYYQEETADIEIRPTKKFLICKSRNRVYFGLGFLKVKIEKCFLDTCKIGYYAKYKKCFPKKSLTKKQIKSYSRLVLKT